MSNNETIKKGIKMMLKNLKSHLKNEEEEGRVAVGIIAVTVEPFGAGTVVLTNRNVENALADMGYIDEDEILTILQNHGKKINHEIREKLANGLPRVIEKMNSEEDL